MGAFTKIKEFVFKYERFISPVTLVLGFITDSFMLRRIDVFFSNALLITYLSIAAIAITLLNVSVTRRGHAGHEDVFHIILLFVMQFSFGGLFSASFLFYSRSGSLIASWPFLALIFAYMIGNELFRKNYMILAFQVSAFFTALFSYLIFFLPVILGKMDDSIFLLSGISSLMITGMFVYVVSWLAPARILRSIPLLSGSIAVIFTVINVLYFTNLIPPIPLALKDIAIYRSVIRLDDGMYATLSEQHSWLERVFGKYEVRMVPGQPVYAWSSIFAPSSLNTNVSHVWQYKDGDDWATATTIRLNIAGGRDSGFRTYSMKENVFPGKWRVNVETARGQLIGRITFTLVPSDGTEELTAKVE
ncbi:MAG: DUF2914 domain-containing protein [bacterium]|nr:DUF2914 domain-containing protein [bacterium]